MELICWSEPVLKLEILLGNQPYQVVKFTPGPQITADHGNGDDYGLLVSNACPSGDVVQEPSGLYIEYIC